MDRLLVGENPHFLAAIQKTERAAGMRILFRGETGVGKTPFAKFSNLVVSRLTGRARPFEQVNCAGLSHDHFQDILFGHRRGAFTGAVADKRGLVDLAYEGDLFLDEVGTLPPVSQAMFLTFLDSMEFYRLGDDKKRTAAVRILSASNVDLRQLVKEGKFRLDLYSRLAQVEIEIPALRERPDDVLHLFPHFVRKFCGFDKPYDPRLLDLFTRCRWDEGNVRQFRDAVEQLCVYSRTSPRLQLDHLPDRYRYPQVSDSTGDLRSDFAPDIGRLKNVGLNRYLAQIERDILAVQLQYHAGSVEAMARSLKTSRSTLYRRIKRCGLFEKTSSPECSAG